MTESQSQLTAPRNSFAEFFTANSVKTKGSIVCLINYQLVFANSENHSCALRHDWKYASWIAKAQHYVRLKLLLMKPPFFSSSFMRTSLASKGYSLYMSCSCYF